MVGLVGQSPDLEASRRRSADWWRVSAEVGRIGGSGGEEGRGTLVQPFAVFPVGCCVAEPEPTVAQTCCRGLAIGGWR